MKVYKCSLVGVVEVVASSGGDEFLASSSPYSYFVCSEHVLFLHGSCLLLHLEQFIPEVLYNTLQLLAL